MKYFIETLVYIIVLFNNSQQKDENIFLSNDLTNIYSKPHTIVKSNNRVKREQSNFNTPSDYANVHHEQCDEHIYSDLYNCSQISSCTYLSSCLRTFHCPSMEKSYGSLILHLLDLLGVNNCDDHDEKSSCSNYHRNAIFHDLLTYWPEIKSNNIDYHDDSSTETIHYCHTITDFTLKVKEIIKKHCSIYSGQVEAFLEKNLCSIDTHDTKSTVPTNNLFDESLNREKSDGTVRKISRISSQITYFNEVDDLNFSNSNGNLSNSTDRTVYINDHKYYNISYIIPKSEGIPPYYIQDNDQFFRIGTFYDDHHSRRGIDLKFSFPFYGHRINKIFLTAQDSLVASDLTHGRTIMAQHYIAPFMSSFDPSINRNQSEIKYFHNSTHFVCTWKNLYSINQKDSSAFTFQAILKNDGTIYFNYITIPPVKLLQSTVGSNKQGSNSFISQYASYEDENQRRVLVFVDKLELDKNKIKNGVSIVLTMYTTCNTFTDCQSCLANRGKRFNCSWCGILQLCSDGNDLSKMQWLEARCYESASKNTCLDNYDKSSNNNSLQHLSSDIHSINTQQIVSDEQHSVLYTLRTIVITLLLTVLILSIMVLVSTYIYAYRYPTSPPGMWLLEHRPSNFITRFKNFTDTNNSSC